MVHPNPWGREYSRAEYAAARRQRIGNGTDVELGPLIYASPTGPLAADLRKLADDYALLADAVQREFRKTAFVSEENA